MENLTKLLESKSNQLPGLMTMPALCYLTPEFSTPVCQLGAFTGRILRYSMRGLPISKEGKLKRKVAK